MTFPKDSAFAREEQLQRDHLERLKDSTVEAARFVNPNIDTGRLREILDEMTEEAIQPVPDEERIQSLASEAREYLEGD